MRKTNNLPWMGRTVGIAVMVLVGLGVFAGSASAQTMVYDFDSAAGWWAAYDCDAMRVILGSGGDGGNPVTLASQSDACKGFDMLSRANQRVIEDFVDPASTATAGQVNVPGPHASNAAWWNAQTPATNCALAQALAGVLPIGTIGTGASTDVEKNLFCRAYADLRDAEEEVVNMAGNGLSGMSGDGMTPTPTPAVPLVGIGILGLLLAGRGAWLRRRA